MGKSRRTRRRKVARYARSEHASGVTDGRRRWAARASRRRRATHAAACRAAATGPFVRRSGEYAFVRIHPFVRNEQLGGKRPMKQGGREGRIWRKRKVESVESDDGDGGAGGAALRPGSDRREGEMEEEAEEGDFDGEEKGSRRCGRCDLPDVQTEARKQAGKAHHFLTATFEIHLWVLFMEICKCREKSEWILTMYLLNCSVSWCSVMGHTSCHNLHTLYLKSCRWM